MWCTSYTVKRNKCLNKLSFTVCCCCIWCRFRRPPWFRWRWRSHLKPIKTLSYHYHPLLSDIAMAWLWDEAPCQVFHIVCKNPSRTSKLNLMQWLRKASSAIINELRKHQYIFRAVQFMESPRDFGIDIREVPSFQPVDSRLGRTGESEWAKRGIKVCWTI